MKNRISHPYSVHALILSATLTASMASWTPAATQVNDTFTDGGITNGSDALDTGWSVLASSLVTLSAGQYATSGNTTTGLIFNSTWVSSGPYPTARGGTFTAPALAVGEAVTLTFDFRVTSGTIPSDGGAFRFAVGSSSASYALRFGSGNISGGTLAVYGADILSGTSTSLTTTGTPIAINNTTSHNFFLKLSRVAADTLAVTAKIDGVNTFTATQSGVTNFTFNRVLLGEGGVNNLDFNMDNVLVSTGVDTPPLSPFGITSGDEAAGSYTSFLPKLQTINVKGLRSFPGWGGIEPTDNSFSWGFVDTRVDATEAAGMQVSAILAYSTSWASPGQPDKTFPMSNLTAYGDYAAAAAGRYAGRINYWEVWNEPNAAAFNPGGYGAAAYASLVKAAYTPAKTAASTANIGLTCANYDIRFLKLTIEQLAAQSAADNFDFLAVHPYELAARTNGWDGQGEVYFLNIVPFLRGMLASIAPSKINVPIRMTEVGAKIGATAEGETIDETLQAEILVKSYAMGIAQGIQQVQWFEVKDQGGSQNFGIMDDSVATERKACKAYGALTSSLGANPVYKGWLAMGTGGVGYGFVFGGATNDVLAAWMPRAQTSSITFTGAVTVVDILTNTTSVLNANTAFSLTERPVLFRGIPSTLTSQAIANLQLPYPWGTAPVNSNLADIDFGVTDVRHGITQGDYGSTPAHTFADGSDGRRINHWGPNNEMAINVDPKFADFNTRDVYVRVTVRKITTGNSAFLQMFYQKASGSTGSILLNIYEQAAGQFNLPDNANWNTFTWHLTDALFANTFGKSFHFFAGTSPVFVIGKVEVSKVPF